MCAIFVVGLSFDKLNYVRLPEVIPIIRKVLVIMVVSKSPTRKGAYENINIPSVYETRRSSLVDRRPFPMQLHQ